MTRDNDAIAIGSCPGRCGCYGQLIRQQDGTVTLRHLPKVSLWTRARWALNRVLGLTTRPSRLY